MSSPLESTESTENAGNGHDDEEALGTLSTLEQAGPCKRRIKAEVPSVKVIEELDRNYKELISSVQIPGFRRGKVPRPLLEKRYGEEIEGDVKETLLALSFQEVVKEKDLKVVGKPKFENIAFSKGEPLRYEVEVEIRPEFELGEYKGVEIAGPGDDEVPPVTAEAIDAQLEKLRQKHGQHIAVDPSTAGAADIFIGHYSLKRDGLRLHLKEDVRFRPENNYLDGIEVPDLAAKVAARGESPTFTVQVTVPDHYTEEVLRGKQVDLEFTVEEAKRVQYPPLDDEFAKHFKVDTLAALKDQIRGELESQRNAQVDRILESRVVEKVIGSLEFDLPEGLIEEQAKQKRMRLEESLLSGGLPREEIDASLKKTDEKSAEELRREVKQFFVLERIADAEKIFATEDEINTHIRLLAYAYGQSPKVLGEQLEESGRIETLRSEIRHSKTLQFLRDKAKVLKPDETGGAGAAGAAVEGTGGEGAGQPAAGPEGEGAAAPPGGEAS
jgi:trigger factor